MKYFTEMTPEARDEYIDQAVVVRLAEIEAEPGRILPSPAPREPGMPWRGFNTELAALTEDEREAILSEVGASLVVRCLKLGAVDAEWRT